MSPGGGTSGNIYTITWTPFLIGKDQPGDFEYYADMWISPDESDYDDYMEAMPWATVDWFNNVGEGDVIKGVFKYPSQGVEKEFEYTFKERGTESGCEYVLFEGDWWVNSMKFKYVPPGDPEGTGFSVGFSIEK